MIRSPDFAASAFQQTDERLGRVGFVPKRSFGEGRSQAGAWDRGKAQGSTTELKHPPAYAGGSPGPCRSRLRCSPRFTSLRDQGKPTQIHHLASRGQDKYLAGKLRW